MKKILVIGSGGAGKSTFARRLGEALRIEVLHLDAMYWHRGWVSTPREVWRGKVAELLEREAWIMDGNYSNTLEMRLAACDTVVFLDVRRTTCLWRAVKRVVMYRGKSRPDMAEGCPERLTLEFLRWIWNYPHRTRPKVLKLLSDNAEQKRIIHLRSQAEIEKFLDSVRSA